MTVYSVYLEWRIAEALLRVRRREAARIAAFLENLRTDPFLEGDYTEHDEIGRPLQVCVIGNHTIVFWADHAVKEVKVVDVRKSDA